MRINRRLFTLTHGVRHQIAGTIALGLLMTGTYIGQSILVAVGVARIFRGAAWPTLIPIVLWTLALNNGWLSSSSGKLSEEVLCHLDPCQVQHLKGRVVSFSDSLRNSVHSDRCLVGVTTR